MLGARGIVKRFGRNVAVDGVSVDVRPGTSVVLMGPSGGGKSTLLRCLALLDAPQAGEIVYEGTSYRFPHSGPALPRVPHPDVCVVFQQMFLWPHLRNRDNITLALRTSAERSRAHELAERLGIEEALDRFPNEISVGQKQRVAIIRALALAPKYLLMDEVTSALDRLNRELVARILQEAMDAGTALLLITHDLEFARHFTNDVMWLENGRIVEDPVR